jgi:RluA family pseudouridine synthase
MIPTQASSSSFTDCPIVFEDSSLLIIDKPEGVLSHPNTKSGGRSAFFGKYDPGERCFTSPRGCLWLVHRLDQDTSGLLLAAKKKEVAQSCRQLFEDRKIQKNYLAMVMATSLAPNGAWRDHLSKRVFQQKVRSTILHGRPANAELSYQVKERFRLPFAMFNSNMSIFLIDIRLETGKTHQIRVQAAARGYPILGDDIYGDFKINRELKKFGLKRLFLHAWHFKLIHPKTSQVLQLEASVPNDLSSFIDELKKFKKV